jgi:arginase
MAEAVKTLRNAGIVDRLRSVDPQLLDLGDVGCPVIDRDSGSEKIHNFEEFLEGTKRVKKKLSRGLESSRLSFCLGGECALVVGSLAALKSVYPGRPGIVWMDAHGDFNIPETSPSGFIGGMPLALACGRGPKLSPDIESSRPLLSEKNVVHIGSRSLDRGEDKALLSGVKVFSAKDVKKNGAAEVALQTARQLSDSSDWIVAHLDVDVFDPSIMPGVHFPENGGLSREEVLKVFHSLQSTGKLKVVDLTAYNPSADVTHKGRSLILGLAAELVKRNGGSVPS